MTVEDKPARASGRRSLAKAVTYRVVVMCADAAAIFILTGAWRIAVGFMVASNIYTTVLYFLHERLWARIGWGLDRSVGTNAQFDRHAGPAG